MTLFQVQGFLAISDVFLALIYEKYLTNPI